MIKKITLENKINDSTTTKTSFYIGGKPASTTGPTPSLFQVSLYVDNNDIGQLAPVFVMEKNNVSG